MSSGVRRLNYTKRQRISREHVSVSVCATSGNTAPVISVDLKLGMYSLPPDAPVLVEAYRHAAWKRFEYGTVGAIQEPSDRALQDFGSTEGVRFRIKVVEPSSQAGLASRILAQADGIAPSHDGPRRSLLPLDPDSSLEHEVWRLEIDENDGPIVKVSTRLVRDRYMLARSPAFVCLALPEILRRVLTWAVERGQPEDEDKDTPCALWIGFGCSLLGQRELPDVVDDPVEGAEAKERWVSDAVSRFCKEHSVESVFGSWWRDGAADVTGGGL